MLSKLKIKPLFLIMFFSSLSLLLISCEQSEINSNNNEISTENLVETVLDSGVLHEVYAYNTIQMGFDSTVSKSNDLKELLKRDDSAYWLLLSYQAIDPLLLDDEWTSIQKGDHAYRIAQLEILLSQNNILEHLNEKQLTELAEEALTTFNQKHSSDIFGRSALNHSLYLMGNVILQAEYKPFQHKTLEDKELQHFLTDGNRFISESVQHDILNYTEQFIKG